jgi:hypothetical protein
LRTLARRLSDAYVAHTRPRAILLLGSAATGDADAYSDLDLLLYYDEPPPEDAVADARHEIGAERFRGKRDETGYGERYFLGGLECQVGHASIPVWEQEIARVVVDLELDQVLLKQMSGLFEGLPLYGEDLIERWRRGATYTERLQRAMIEKHWGFFPWWYFEERLGARDATIWRYDVLVQSAYNIVGVVAALNGLYFSTFEFKRAGKFLARLEVAPPNFAARLKTLFDSDERGSTAELERLVDETQALVARRFPDIDLSLEWGGKSTPPGAREPPWMESSV